MGKRCLQLNIRQLLLLLYLSFWSVLVQAAPANGFAVYFGPLHSRNPGQDITGNGISINADAQMAVNDHWSLNPYLELSYETTNQPFSLLDGSAGLQARYWTGQWFIGAQYLFHDENRRQNGNITAGIYGAAFGLTTGWEWSNHWSVVLEINGFEGQGLDLNSHNSRTDARIQIGYRWY